MSAMKTIILLLLLAIVSLVGAQTTSIVTENYLNANFTEKYGITPGTENTRAMDCDEIKSRYQVEISGATSTGSRCPSQNQLSAAEVISLTGFAISVGSSANPVDNSITIPSGTKLLVVTIHSLYANRDFSAPTWNGTSMLSPWGNSYPAEVWYLINPSAGTYTLSVPNAGTTRLIINYFWYTISSGSVSLYSNARTGGTSTNPNTTGLFETNKKVLMIDAVTYRNYNNNTLSYSSNSDVYRV